MWAWDEDSEFDGGWGDDAESRSEFADDGWAGEPGLVDEWLDNHPTAELPRLADDTFDTGADLHSDETYSEGAMAEREEYGLDRIGDDIFDGSDEGVQRFVDDRAMAEYWEDEFDTDAGGLEHWDEAWADAPNQTIQHGFDDLEEWADQQDWEGADAQRDWESHLDDVWNDPDVLAAREDLLREMDANPDPDENADDYVDEEIEEGLRDGWLNEGDLSSDRLDDYYNGTGAKADDVMRDIEGDLEGYSDFTEDEQAIADAEGARDELDDVREAIREWNPDGDPDWGVPADILEDPNWEMSGRDQGTFFDLDSMDRGDAFDGEHGEPLGTWDDFTDDERAIADAEADRESFADMMREVMEESQDTGSDDSYTAQDKEDNSANDADEDKEDKDNMGGTGGLFG